MSRSFKQFLIEAPIADYKTVGNFAKGSSFTRPRDRFLITNPSTITRTKSKFANTEHNLNFIFVNNKEARNHTEVGLVKPEWVKANLGDEVYDEVMKCELEDHVTVIFTNNKGDKGVPMSAWMIGHRLAHATAREGGRREAHTRYMEASNTLIRMFSDIMDEHYGARMDLRGERSLSYNQPNARDNQLVVKNFFQKVCTFRSAREGMIRDWFEVLNELIPQYLTTGSIKFKEAPIHFKGGGRNWYRKSDDETNESIQYDLENIARTMEHLIDDIFYSLNGAILVM